MQRFIHLPGCVIARLANVLSWKCVSVEISTSDILKMYDTWHSRGRTGAMQQYTYSLYVLCLINSL